MKKLVYNTKTRTFSQKLFSDNSAKAGLFNDDNWELGKPSHVKTFKEGTHTKDDVSKWLSEMSDKDNIDYEIMWYSPEENDFNPYVQPPSWLKSGGE